MALRASNTLYTVGDASGWITPSSLNFYIEWASKQSFTVGDTLLFNFSTGRHDVTEVSKEGSKEGYDQCIPGDNIIKDGPATIDLTDGGDHYYICSFEGHCLSDKKLAIKVSPTVNVARRYL
ncbi:putative cupredoxin, partial [Tanacetum coccineum]